ncbi:hypothetical protein [Flavihumibacter petaseus]|uniref:Uncharacterized protein n=1 Tax=Flavihumibacter petaseus NBRC 106054 TaxID=1220578 RepID=A0A0E9MX82_9BACT|nr:hypothetical protein [Flavihumibacter petaseus]GAO42021.1 hypothetical protein FPE01S_01_10340 [Flavihumibacter petaseus NBRC 106054]
MADNNKSPHILNTSANLLGFCLLVLTSIKISRFNTSTIIDEVTGVASMLFMTSCILSFLSMKNSRERISYRLEHVADLAFLGALMLLFITIALVSFNLFGVNNLHQATAAH